VSSFLLSTQHIPPSLPMATYPIDHAENIIPGCLISSLLITHEQIYSSLILSLQHQCPSAYFHTTQVSYPADSAKEASLREMYRRLCDRLLLSQPKTCDQELFNMRAEATYVLMESSDTYDTLIQCGQRSMCSMWVALFFTQDTSWHYWAAVFRDRKRGAIAELDIYVLALDDSGGDGVHHEQQKEFKPSQIQLLLQCCLYHWQVVRLRPYKTGKEVEVDEAIRWTKAWKVGCSTTTEDAGDTKRSRAATCVAETCCS
jgi:hypothetical protein